MDIYSVRIIKRGELVKASFKGKYDIKLSDLVLVDIDGIECLGRVVKINKDDKNTKDLNRIIKKASSHDINKEKELEKDANEVINFAKSKAKELKLDMKFIKGEYNLSKSKIILYFTSENRVDFRELVKILVSHTKARVELKQIGPRDEFKMFPTIGPCGRKICCANHLNKFSSVTIKDVKEQGLQINMGKISGICGKLMCCIKYEQESYKENVKLLPKYNQEVTIKETKETGRVAGIDILNLKIRVKIINDKDEVKYETFKNTDLDYKLRR